jgi:hypothetical protein
MTRLITFGCSHTFGQALPDLWNHKNNKTMTDSENNKNWNRDTSSPSKYAWPQLLADKLNFECINCAKIGASNKEIWNIILNTKLYKTDVIVILWTVHYGRYAIVTKEELANLNVSGGSKHPYKKECDIYFKYIYDEFDASLDSYLRINHIENFLKDKVLVKHYSPVLEREIDSTNTPYNTWDFFEPSWNKVNVLEIFPGPVYDLDKALDGSHQGPESHKAFATAIYNEIKNDLC